MSTGNVTTRAQLDATVRDVLGVALDRPVGPSERVTRSTEPAWDSVKHIEILFMLEEELGITFEEHELVGLDGLDEIVDRAAAHLGVG